MSLQAKITARETLDCEPWVGFSISAVPFRIAFWRRVPWYSPTLMRLEAPKLARDDRCSRLIAVQCFVNKSCSILRVLSSQYLCRGARHPPGKPHDGRIFQMTCVRVFGATACISCGCTTKLKSRNEYTNLFYLGNHVRSV